MRFGASLVAQLVKNPPAMQKTLVPFLGQEDLQEKVNIQKTKIITSGPITSWEIDGETVTDFIYTCLDPHPTLYRRAVSR